VSWTAVHTVDFSHSYARFVYVISNRLCKAHVTLGNVACNLSRYFVVLFQDKLHEMLHSEKRLYATLEKLVVALRGSLWKVEPTSTSCKDCSTKKLRGIFISAPNKIQKSTLDHFSGGGTRCLLTRGFSVWENNFSLFFYFSAEDAVEKKHLSSDSSRGVSVEDNGVPTKKHEVTIHHCTLLSIQASTFHFPFVR